MTRHEPPPHIRYFNTKTSDIIDPSPTIYVAKRQGPGMKLYRFTTSMAILAKIKAKGIK